MSLLAAGVNGPSPVVLAIFSLAGLVCLWCGVNWAFDVRGITTRRSERIRQRNAHILGMPGALDAPTTVFGSVGYLRFLGALMTFAGLILLVAAYALWHLR
ncbi:hypothetical protein [Streptomyces sp. NBC_01361]|uniref:hypothetical protein n=1 Tax=Streptomyces sp. NBC_01361 TaxID=2903838 RepID=UPI002E2F60A4|nr:hypothetical protein [Streptomyces sp. NBC_01361]